MLKNLIFKYFICTILVLFLLQSGGSMGWPADSPPLLSHPWFTTSHYDGEAVWFAGFWYGAILLRFDIAKEQWESFYHSGIDLCCSKTIFFEEDRILFIGSNESSFTFQKEHKNWDSLTSFDSEYYHGWSGLKKYKTIRFEKDLSEADLKKQTISVNGYEYIGLGSKIYKSKNNEIIDSFKLPTLFTQMLLHYRPHVREHFGYDESVYSFSDVIGKIEQEIGQMILKDDRIWFGITFYEGEGSEGVGGLGFFDLNAERFGILRAPFLLDCSISQLATEEDQFWILTETRGEGGGGLCSGLIKYNIKNGEYIAYTPPLKPYNDLTALNFIKAGPSIWQTTPQGIVEFNFKTNEWRFWAVNKVEITKQDTEVLSGIATHNVSGQFAKSGKLVRGKLYDLWWAESAGGFSFFEIRSPFTLTGWMSEADYKSLQITLKRFDWTEFRTEVQALSSKLYTDEDLSNTIGYHIAGDFEVQEKRGDKIKVSTKQGWIKAEDVVPRVGLIRKIPGGFMRGVWPNRRGNIISLMQKTADSEYATASEIEKMAVITEEKTCLIETSQEMNVEKKNLCDISTNGSVGFGTMIFNLGINTQAGIVYGIPDLSIGFSGYIDVGFTISPEGYDFFGPGIRSKDRETAQKGQKYKASDHRHRITAEILDFKIKTVTFDSGVTRLLFDWIKLKVTVAQYPPVK